MLHPDDFAFLCVTNNTKLERLHQAASRTITDTFSFLSIPLLSEASQFSLLVIPIHFALFI